MRNYTRRSADQWQALINEQDQSELSAPEFCKRHNLGYASFCHWRKRLSESDKQSASFVALTPPSQPPTESHWAVELQLGQDIVLRIAKH
jgi:hypothetical protein